MISGDKPMTQLHIFFKMCLVFRNSV